MADIEALHIMHHPEIIGRVFQMVASDLMYLSEQNQLQTVLESGEAGAWEALSWVVFKASSLYLALPFFSFPCLLTYWSTSKYHLSIIETTEKEECPEYTTN